MYICILVCCSTRCTVYLIVMAGWGIEKPVIEKKIYIYIYKEISSTQHPVS